ncbi:NACHT, LRR and PYD domains-containing protein 3-like [Megalobrama amblycephala]|uniref:NACHT, LRR and PYD domains-containing protein 3-like n=1 Tax=Megalobrama amblycephala TaxID=75352 RepID=UPI002013E99E|nr:NACHT, LRR and PYD domains-containing protein 3-like [Megalobrama amblycephala]
MASVEELLEKSLNELKKAELKKFQWHLKKHGCISNSDMENADRLDTVDKMVACFGPKEAVKIMVEILRKMNQNNLAEQLENNHKPGQAEGNMKTSAAVDAHSKDKLVQISSAHCGVSVDVNAETGATVNAPLLAGNTITGPVTFIYNSAGNGINIQGCKPISGEKGSAAEHSKAALHEISFRLKDKLKQDYKQILVGNSQTGHQKYLDDIYTDLYVVENETGGRVNDHEVRQLELNLKPFDAKDTTIQCNNIFKVQKGRQNRKVLTMGIAGVGKTVSVNKYILDWAEEKENQDIVFILPLPFRELNLITKDYSLIGLLHEHVFSGTEELLSLPEGDGKVMFIFDGLDECRFPLNFKKGDKITDVNKITTVSKIVTSLIKRDLLPSALIWITSRPAAASLIPRDYIDQVTEVRGFNDGQKEQYFIKNSPDVSENIIRHIKKNRSLYMMCHIPVFCWISLTVLQPLARQNDKKTNDQTPTTLTGMYTRFLISQQHQMEKKYCEPKANARSFDQIILMLGKLAFQQLEKGNLIFYKKDLEECGLDVSEGSVYSGLCTQIFQEEKAFAARSVYSFIHLSVQEFLAALYVFLLGKDERADIFLSWKEKLTWKLSKKPLFKLHNAAVKKALQSENGHLDLFLRFYLGLLLESNQSDLMELLPELELKTENVKDTVDYIKLTIEKEKSVEKTINLFYCLSELKDNFVEEIQKNLSSGNLSAQNLSSAQWSGLVFVLLMSEETQEKFELEKYRKSDDALMRLLPVIKNTRRALLQSCNLTAQSCESLSSVLKSSNSFLRELDLSNNDLQDSGVKLLSDGLKSPNFQLKILRFSTCNLTAQCCESLSSALQSSNSVLRELDLSNNDLKDYGVKLLSDGLKSPNCQLEIMRLSGCMVTKDGCGYVSSALSSNPLHLRELDLSYNHPGDSGVKLLTDKLNHPNYRLDKLNVDHGGEIRITAGLHKYSHQFTLDLNTVNKNLCLSENNRVITGTNTVQPYPDHPDRFDIVYQQVLCRESVSGRCYWEIECNVGVFGVFISVSYKSISRKGQHNECMFGSNDQSWILYCTSFRCFFRHNNIDTELPVKSISSRIGVYVDHSAGTLSFYSIRRNTTKLIHTVQTTFTQPLYPGFWVYPGSSVKLC